MNTQPIAIVIGASRGGFEAVRGLAWALPVDFPAAVFVVLHTHPESPMVLADLIGSKAPLPVTYGTQGDMARTGHIYVAPPNCHMVVRPPGFIFLESGPMVHYTRPAADVLFESAAKTYGARVVGVVMTGGGCDGTAGLQAIHAAGGITVVQDPEDAQDSSMPRHAILGTQPDHVVPLEKMAEVLSKLVRQRPSMPE